ncbi:MAG: YkgJ family cysteine cluster protein [Rhizomicrobium sp.]
MSESTAIRASQVPPPLDLRAGETEKFDELSAMTRALLDILRGDAPTRAGDMAMVAHEALDRSIAHNPPPQKPACAKGCGFCCRVYVSASAPEVFALMRAMRGLPPEHFARMRERVRAAARAVTAHWSGNYAVTQQCPILEDNACALYAARPDPCRGVSSYSARSCEISMAALSEGRDEPVPQVQEHGILRALHTHTFWAALKAAKLPYATYSLNHALDRALDTNDAEARWLAGEDVFAGVQQDTSLTGRNLQMVEATMDVLIGGATGTLEAPAV